jgi:hypothetical protein
MGKYVRDHENNLSINEDVNAKVNFEGLPFDALCKFSLAVKERAYLSSKIKSKTCGSSLRMEGESLWQRI